MAAWTVRRIVPPVRGLEELIAEAGAEGFDFLDELIADWESGKYRFDGPHEGLFGVYVVDELVAIGALSVDPFVGRADTGRLRRIFVRKAWRRQGIGEGLVKALMVEAAKGYAIVRLRAETPYAAGLYERMGFVPIVDENASHERAVLGAIETGASVD
ncbi:GNAT family N-acetyltransferase [Granulicella sibirica]|uniref:Acetyltransferase, GNAT family n=1 Tax=Granulicella sibirica TaxID=2479048 RepID=A0A4Q0SZ45_9BACT|nr:GNAT family N-acetyltransferase [Granulicella sibirica]RXH54908.1 acetyltransferase, GNAT family [Granulicella sibirica]